MKTKVISGIALITIAYIAISCRTTLEIPRPDLNMVIKPGTSFSKEDAITIVRKHDAYDVSGAEGIITNQLMLHGFNVISSSVAKTAVRYKQESQGVDALNNELTAEMYSVKELKSIYALEFEGVYQLDIIRLPKHYDFTNFSATVIDLSTGEIVASANFVGNKPVKDICTEFVNQMTTVFH